MAKFYQALIFFSSLLYLALATPQPAMPAARHLVARAQPTSWHLPHRVTPRGAIKRPEIEVRQQRQSQIPFQWCPEFFGNDPKQCSQCGGDSKVKGKCDNILVSGVQYNCQPRNNYQGCYGYYCDCVSDNKPDPNPKVTITTVVDGQTGTAVWEPLTLTDYTQLRASTTVTITESATNTGDSQVETVVAVVFAGGVAWWMACKLSVTSSSFLSIQTNE
jgi:hypothetical protein